MKIVFWIVMPRSLIDIYRRFGGMCRLHLQIEAASPSEISVNIYQTTRCDISEDTW
jgi:hypothetical protein